VGGTARLCFFTVEQRCRCNLRWWLSLNSARLAPATSRRAAVPLLSLSESPRVEGEAVDDDMYNPRWLLL